MKRLTMSILLISFAVVNHAQTSKLTGSWLLTKVEDGDKIFEPYFITDFKQDGKMEVMGIEAGTWEFVKKGNAIIMKSDLDKDFNGVSKILKLNKKELIVNKGGAKLYYTKVNQEEINKANEKSNFQGVWKLKLKDTPDLWKDETHYIRFELPDNFLAISDENGAVSKTKGTWLYCPKEKNIIIIGRLQTLSGKSKIKEIGQNELEFENKGSTFIAKKVKVDSNSIERLTFKQEDFEEEAVSDVQLPWYFEEMIPFLSNVNSLKYRKGSLIEELNVFEYQTIISQIEANSDKQNVKFSNLFVSNGDTTQLSENYKGGLSEKYNDFFPKKEPWPYRILAKETITVPAGSYNCIVIEGFDGDNKLKYWMIKDKPGVYAKIIIEGEGVFGDLEYNVFELEEIK